VHGRHISKPLVRRQALVHVLPSYYPECYSPRGEFPDVLSQDGTKHCMRLMRSLDYLLNGENPRGKSMRSVKMLAQKASPCEPLKSGEVQ